MASLHRKAVPFHSSYSPGSGAFATGNSEWYICRDTYHKYYFQTMTKGKRGFYYNTTFDGLNRQEIGEIRDVITEAEDRLNLVDEDRLQLWPVIGHEFAIFCEPGEWWIDPIRYTFLTALMRDANLTLERSIIRGKYLAPTRAAAEWFLKGNTFYWPETFDGWVETFKTNDYCDKLGNTPVPDRLTVQCRHHYTWAYHDMPLVKR